MKNIFIQKNNEIDNSKFSIILKNCEDFDFRLVDNSEDSEIILCHQDDVLRFIDKNKKIIILERIDSTNIWSDQIRDYLNNKNVIGIFKNFILRDEKENNSETFGEFRRHCYIIGKSLNLDLPKENISEIKNFSKIRNVIWNIESSNVDEKYNDFIGEVEQLKGNQDLALKK